MILLNLNDGCSEINKRRIRLDIAQPPRNRQRNNRRNNGNRSNQSLGGGEIDGSKFRGGKFQQRSTAPAERPGLKLAPRSKPVGDKDGKNGSDSNIFGSAKPRDGDWRSSRSQEERNGGNGGGRGGGGRQPRRNSRNGSGRGGQARRGIRTETKKEKAIPVAPLPVIQKEAKNVTKTANSFAAFGFDSDSD